MSRPHSRGGVGGVGGAGGYGARGAHADGATKLEVLVVGGARAKPGNAAAAAAAAEAAGTAGAPSGALQPGTFLGCERRLHGPMRNCAGCGLIFAQAAWEASDRCPFCARPTSSQKDRRRRLDEGEDEAGLLRATELKNRLVAYDRDAAARSRVIDDQAAGAAER